MGDGSSAVVAMALSGYLLDDEHYNLPLSDVALRGSTWMNVQAFY